MVVAAIVNGLLFMFCRSFVMIVVATRLLYRTLPKPFLAQATFVSQQVRLLPVGVDFFAAMPRASAQRYTVVDIPLYDAAGASTGSITIILATLREVQNRAWWQSVRWDLISPLALRVVCLARGHPS